MKRVYKVKVEVVALDRVLRSEYIFDNEKTMDQFIKSLPDYATVTYRGFDHIFTSAKEALTYAESELNII